jgi:LacI family transcriptional regulator
MERRRAAVAIEHGCGRQRNSGSQVMASPLSRRGHAVGTKRSGAVTIRDIARQTGVSVNTVSRALTGKYDISAKTKARVLAAAKRLGYTPNLMARSLVQGRTRTLGLLVTDCTHPFYATLIREVEKVAAGSGYALLLATSNEDVVKEAAGIRLLTERRVDGLLLSPVSVEAPHIRRGLSRARLPSVLLARRPTAYKGAFVGTDNVEAAKLAVRHLIELGHRRIAHVTRSDPVASAVERLEGYRQEIERAGFGYEAPLVLEAPQTVEGGRTAAGQILQQAPAPTAVFAYSDLQAIGILLGLREAGVNVPKDMSVIGFDDIEFARYMTPPLTTVAQSVDQIGRISAHLLIDILEGRAHRTPHSHLLPGSLVVRGSTGRPRS